MDVAEIQVYAPLPTSPPRPPGRPPPVQKLKFLTSKAKLSKRRAFIWKL